MPSDALAPLHVGTSGWTYERWRDGFYAGVPRARWLAHYASVFDAVEVNASFYHALKPATFAHWREATPAAFRFCLKAHRWITHVERLAVEGAAIARERERAAPLGDKLAIVLWQLPQSLQRDLPRLQGFVRQLAEWPRPRHAIEFRHASWFEPPLNPEWVSQGEFRLRAGVKGGRSPAQRTLEAGARPVRWPSWAMRHADASATTSRSD